MLFSVYRSHINPINLNITGTKKQSKTIKKYILSSSLMQLQYYKSYTKNLGNDLFKNIPSTGIHPCKKREGAECQTLRTQNLGFLHTYFVLLPNSTRIYLTNSTNNLVITSTITDQSSFVHTMNNHFIDSSILVRSVFSILISQNKVNNDMIVVLMVTINQ